MLKAKHLEFIRMLRRKLGWILKTWGYNYLASRRNREIKEGDLKEDCWKFKSDIITLSTYKKFLKKNFIYKLYFLSIYFLLHIIYKQKSSHFSFNICYYLIKKLMRLLF